MLVSKIYKIEGGKSVLLGEIGVKDSALSFHPDNPVLEAMCREPIAGPEGIIQPEDAEAFVDNLYLHYRNVYLRATKATEETDDAA